MPSSYYGKSKSHRFEVNTTQQNVATRQLMRPVEHTHVIQFHCEPPKTSKLNFSQKYRI
jgi:hypothetical protein